MLVRNEVYRSEVALWEIPCAIHPGKRPYNNLGYAYFLTRNLAQAEQAYLTAIRLNPDYWLAENNLAQLRNNKE